MGNQQPGYVDVQPLHVWPRRSCIAQAATSMPNQHWRLPPRIRIDPVPPSCARNESHEGDVQQLANNVNGYLTGPVCAINRAHLLRSRSHDREQVRKSHSLNGGASRGRQLMHSLQQRAHLILEP